MDEHERVGGTDNERPGREAVRQKPEGRTSSLTREDAVLRLQRSAGNAAVTAALRRPRAPGAAATVAPGPQASSRVDPASGALAAGEKLSAAPVEAETLQRATVKVGGEEVEVSFLKRKKEKAEAEAIIKEIKDKYGVELNSKATVDGIKDQYTNVPDAVKKSLETRKWRLVELYALRTALWHYRTILGANRASSSRKDEAQEVTSVGKVKQAIDTNKPTGRLDSTTLGEYFRAKKNMGLFKASEGLATVHKTEADELTHTFIHEIAHGLLNYAIPEFIQAVGGPTSGYWTDRNTPSGIAGAEAPCTSYHPNAAEDMCDTAAMYFVDPKRLKDGTGARKGQDGNACPLRYAFMEKIGKDWVPPPPQTALVQDAPPTTAVPATDGTGAAQGASAPVPSAPAAATTDAGAPPPSAPEHAALPATAGGSVPGGLEQTLETGDILVTESDAASSTASPVTTG